MKEIQSFQYPIWIRILMRVTTFFGWAVILYAVGFFSFLIYISSGSLAIIGISIVSGLIIFGFFGRTYLGAFIAFPKIEVENNQMKIIGLFFASDWFDLDDISSAKIYDHPDPSGVIFKSFYVVECAKLPWPSRFVSLPLRPLIGKKGPCFLVGQRIQGFKVLREILQRRGK